MASSLRSGGVARSSGQSSSRSAIVAAALEELAELDLKDLLACLTPGSLAGGRAFSPSTVRYHFGQEASRFDREALAAELIDDLSAKLRAHARASAASYTRALDAVAAGAEIDVVQDALARDLEPFMPGASSELATAEDRLYLLAVAMCDSSGPLTAELRAVREDVLAGYERVYEACLQATGRQLQRGVTLRDLTIVINAFLEGLMLLGRQRTAISLPATTGAVVRIVWAFTVPEGEDSVDWQAELVRATRRQEARPASS